MPSLSDAVFLRRYMRLRRINERAYRKEIFKCLNKINNQWIDDIIETNEWTPIERVLEDNREELEKCFNDAESKIGLQMWELSYAENIRKKNRQQKNKNLSTKQDDEKSQLRDRFILSLATFAASRIQTIVPEIETTIAKRVHRRVAIATVLGIAPRQIARFIDEDVRKDARARRLLSLTKNPRIIDGIVEDSLSAANRNRLRFQSLTIARTETGIVQNYANAEAGHALDARTKQWHNLGDGRVRVSHRNVRPRQSIPVNDYFTVGSSSMLHPSDKNGSAKEVINCRCFLTHDFAGDPGPFIRPEIDEVIESDAAAIVDAGLRFD